MEVILAFVIGAIFGFAGACSALRRARKKPTGITAKIMAMVGGGGGPDPGTP